MPFDKDPKSKRSQRRANRNFTGSRPERRAANRLSVATAAYQRGHSLDAAAFTKPGKQAHW